MALRTVMRGGSRLYKVANGSEYPSVTSVLNVLDKPGLLPWAVNLSVDTLRGHLLRARENGALGGVDEEWIAQATARATGASEAVRKRAASYGTRVHEAIDDVLRGRGVPAGLPPDIAALTDAFRRWHDESGIVIDPRGDTMVVSHRYCYAGAMDAIGRMPDGRLVVLDFKTSNAVHDTYAMQLAAYAHAAAEMRLGDTIAIDASATATANSNASAGGGGRGDGDGDGDGDGRGDGHGDGHGDGASARARSEGQGEGEGEGEGEGMGHEELPCAMVVRIDKASGRIEVQHVADMTVAFDAFKAALLLWRSRNLRLLEAGLPPPPPQQ